MRIRTFTQAMMAGAILFFSSQAVAQTSEEAQHAPGKLTKAQEIERKQKEYEEKRVARYLARQQARQAKADAREARYQEDEALEAAKIAECLAKLELKAQRKQERRNARKEMATEGVVSK